MNAFLQRSARLILDHDKYALAITVLFICTPFFMWLAIAIMCLITLRRGYAEGSKILAISILTSSLFFYNDIYTLTDVLITLIVSYGSALLLRAKSNWNPVGISLLILGLLSVGFFHLYFPSVISDQFNELMNIIKSIDGSNIIVEKIQAASPENKANFAFYIFGIKIVSLIFSVVSSLALARCLQSALFYPGGFTTEMRSFRAHRCSIALLVLAILALANQYFIALAWLPLLVSYFMMAGISLIYYFLDKKSVKTGLLLILTVIIVPYIILPIYAFLGVLDCLFNFRLRLPLVQNIKS